MFQNEWSDQVRTRAKELSVSLLHKPMTKNRLNGVLHMVASLRLQRITISRSIPVQPIEKANMIGSFIMDSLNQKGAAIVIAPNTKRQNSLQMLMKASRSKKKKHNFQSCAEQSSQISTALKDARTRAHRNEVQRALLAMGLAQIDLSLASADQLAHLRIELAKVAKAAQQLRAGVVQNPSFAPALQSNLNSAIESFCASACTLAVGASNDEDFEECAGEVLKEHRAIQDHGQLDKVEEADRVDDVEDIEDTEDIAVVAVVAVASQDSRKAETQYEYSSTGDDCYDCSDEADGESQCMQTQTPVLAKQAAPPVPPAHICRTKPHVDQLHASTATQGRPYTPASLELKNASPLVQPRRTRTHSSCSQHSSSMMAASARAAKAQAAAALAGKSGGSKQSDAESAADFDPWT